MTSVCQAAEAHKNFAKEQQNVFSEQIKSVLRRRPVCVVDYKAKVILGQSYVQIGHEFYESPMRSLLGFTLYIHPDDFDRVRAALPLELHGYRIEQEVDPAAEAAPDQPAQAPHDRRGKNRQADQPPPVRKPWKIHFEFVFDVVSQNGWQTIAGIRALLQHEFVQALDPLGFTFWMDNGSHFKNKEVARFFADCGDYDIAWNHFAAQHGKNVQDTRFSAIQQFFDLHCNTENGSMRSSDEIVQVIKSGQTTVNKKRAKSNKRPTIAFQQVVQVPPMPETADILQFDDIRVLHSFVIDRATRKVSAFLQTNSQSPANLDFEPVTVARKVKTLTVGHPNPLDPASVEHQKQTLKSLTGLQVQRRKLGDDKFVCNAVKTAVPLPNHRAARRAPPARRAPQNDEIDLDAPASTRQKRKERVVEDDDDEDGGEFLPPSKRARTEEVPRRSIGTRSKKGAAKQVALTTALKTVNNAARKKRMSADEMNAIHGLREVFRAEIRAAGNETATQGDLAATWRNFALVEARRVVQDYEDDREDDMDVDDADAMEVDEEFEAIWQQVPAIPYNNGR